MRRVRRCFASHALRLWGSRSLAPGNSVLGRVLIKRQPNADLDVPPNVRYWG
jgi:hypothetical protein